MFGVVYTPEELGAKVDESGEPVVDETGHIILDGVEATEQIEVPQEVVDKAGWEIAQSPDLLASANTVVLARKNLWQNLVPNIQGVENQLNLDELWMARLEKIVGNRKTSKEDLGIAWKAANGTNVLRAPINNAPDDTLEIRIKIAVAKLEEAQKQADIVQAAVDQTEATEILDGELVPDQL